MTVRIKQTLICFILFTASCASAKELTLKIIDNGPGLAILGVTPSNNSFVFDAGHPSKKGRSAIESVFKQALRPKSNIDFMVLSHPHKDHLGSVPYILTNYQVNTLYRTGQTPAKIKKPYLDSISAIEAAIQHKQLKDITALSGNLYPGLSFALGETHFTFLTGFSEPPKSWNIPKNNESYRLNSASLVLKISYKNQSILIMGDALGIDEENHQFDKPWSTEAYLLKHWYEELDSDVLIAGHHCDNDASSVEFLKAVSPTYVVCSAGHAGNRPHQGAITRILKAGVRASNIYRTDEGDSEQGLCIKKHKKSCENRRPSEEWGHSTNHQVIDEIGDDTIIINLNQTIKITQKNQP